MSRQRFLIEQARKKKESDTRDSDRRTADTLLSTLFPAQRAFVLDRSRRKAALCPRRSGKSYCVLVYALICCLYRPESEVLILARVRRQAKAIYWQTLKRLCEDHDIKAHFKGMDLECHFPNGSVIYLSGADTQEEIDKYRGRAFDLCVIDEGKSYSGHLLDELVYEVISPALSDRRGILAMIGTPGVTFDGLFWAVTTEQKQYKPHGSDRSTSLNVRRFEKDLKLNPYSWILHKWKSQDNIAQPHIWDDALQEKEANGWADDDPFWLREREGEWVADASALVYAYSRVTDGRCDWVRGTGPHGLEPGHEWRYILGVDLGWHDDTAFVVAAWSPTHRALHYIHTEKAPYMDALAVIERIRQLEAMFGGFDARVMDTASAGKQIAESMGTHYGLHIEPARKSEKLAYIALQNADITAGKIKVDPRGPLVEEWRTVQYGNAERTEVDRACEDHLSDAAAYVWRYAHHHWFKQKAESPEQGTIEWRQSQRREELKAMAVQQAAANEGIWKRLANKANRLPRSASTLTRWKHS